MHGELLDALKAAGGRLLDTLGSTTSSTFSTTILLFSCWLDEKLASYDLFGVSTLYGSGQNHMINVCMQSCLFPILLLMMRKNNGHLIIIIIIIIVLKDMLQTDRDGHLSRNG